MRIGRRIVVTATAIVLVLTGVAPAAAAVGSSGGWIDPTFGRNGVAIVPRTGAGHDVSVDANLVVAPTGRIYVLAERETSAGERRFELTAFTPKGRLDPDFNRGRPVVLFVDDAHDPDCCIPYGPVPTADSGLIVGLSFLSFSEVRRYRPNGRLAARARMDEPSFGMVGLAGGSAGSINADALSLSGPAPLHLVGFDPWGDPDTRVGSDGSRRLAQRDPAAIIRDSENRFFVVGSQYPTGALDQRVLDVRRYGSSGVEDERYGNGGAASIPIDPGDLTPGFRLSRSRSLAVSLAGALFLAGDATTSSGRASGILRKLDPTGVLASSFGSGGALELPAPSGTGRWSALGVDPTGRPLLAFVDRSGPARTSYLARLDGDTGNLDPTFGRGGLVRTAGLTTAIATTGSTHIVTVSRRVVDGRWVLDVTRRTS